jgi:hypothetical protein
MRPPVRDPDLTWLFCEAEGDFGLRSSHGTLVDLALSGVTSGGGSAGPRALAPWRVEAATRERSIGARLAGLSSYQRTVLFVAYGPQPWPREVRQPAVFGPWPGVLLLVPSAPRAFARAMWRGRVAAKTRAAGSQQDDVLRLDVAVDDGGRALGPLRDTSLDAMDAVARRGLGEWLRSPATLADKALLSRLRAEAQEMVAEAYAAYRPLAVAEVEPRHAPRARRGRREIVAVEELR